MGRGSLVVICQGEREFDRNGSGAESSFPYRTVTPKIVGDLHQRLRE